MWLLLSNRRKDRWHSHPNPTDIEKPGGFLEVLIDAVYTSKSVTNFGFTTPKKKKKRKKISVAKSKKKSLVIYFWSFIKLICASDYFHFCFEVQFELDTSLHCTKQLRPEPPPPPKTKKNKNKNTRYCSAGTPNVLRAHPHISVCASALLKTSRLYSLQPWCGCRCIVHWNCNYPSLVGFHSCEEFLSVCWDFANGTSP